MFSFLEVVDENKKQWKKDEIEITKDIDETLDGLNFTNKILLNEKMYAEILSLPRKLESSHSILKVNFIEGIKNLYIYDI
jgi:hypothetical protein